MAKPKAKKLSREAQYDLMMAGGQVDDRRGREYDKIVRGLSGDVTVGSYTGGGVEKSALEEAGNRFTEIGGNALKALSVPQASVFTAGAKLGGRDVSWKNALGDFHKNEKGQTGLQVVLSNLGIKNKWAQAGVGLVADPLWFVGGGLVKSAKAGENVISKLDDAVDAVRVAQATVSTSKANIARMARNARSAKTAETRTKWLKEIDKERKALRKSTVDLRVAKKTLKDEKSYQGKSFTDMLEMDEAGNLKNLDQSLRRIRETASGLETREGMNYGLRLGFGRPRPKVAAPDLPKVPAGHIRLYRAQPKKFTSDSTLAHSAVQKDAPAALRGTWFTPTRKYAEEFGDELYYVDVPKSEVGRYLADGTQGHVFDVMGEYNLPAEIASKMRPANLAAAEARAPRKLSFRKDIDLGISAKLGWKGRGLRGKGSKAGVFAMKPVEKVAHALRRSGAELAEGATAAMLRLADNFGMTMVDDAGRKVIKETDAAVVGVYRAARNANRDLGEAVRQEFIRQGRWSDNHDGLIKAIDERMKYLKEKDGLNDVEDWIVRDSEKLQKQLDEIDGKLSAQKGGDNAVKGKARTKLENQRAEIQKQLDTVKERGEYTKLGIKQSEWDDMMQVQRKKVRRGEAQAGDEFMRVKPAKLTKAERKMFKQSAFSNMTAERFMDDMLEAGLDEDSARQLMQIIHGNLEFKGLPGFKEMVKEGAYTPEWNAFLLAGRREQQHVWAQVEKQTEDLIKQSGILRDSELARTILKGRKGEQVGSISGTTGGQMIREGIAHLKGFLTFANPSHYVTNSWGDYWNSLINGNWRMSASSASIPKSSWQQLANAEVRAAGGIVDDVALSKVWNIGGRDYTGHELLALSRMSGLGRGYVGTDVAIMVDVFESAGRGPREWYRFMQRMNIKRENAQRVHTWVKHMQDGDDPLVAAAKTLRVHFDYTQLTEFEKLWARNLLLFYTWMKRNAILQAGGMVTRPGLYNAVYNNFERTREQFPNEPGYYSKQGAVPFPGFGAFAPGSPWADIHKWDLTWDGFRKDVLGAVTPPVRVPVELATNQKMFTGERIQDYEGQKTPYWLAEILGGTTTTAKSGGEKGKGWDPKIVHALSQVLGPQAATAAAVGHPDFEGSGWQAALGRFLGLRPQIERPEAFARSAKYVKAKEKADETRRKNAQKE